MGTQLENNSSNNLTDNMIPETKDLDRLELYDYQLPPELIASQPLPERDASRLLMLNRETGEISHHKIADLPQLLRPGDCLVFNNSKVVPARIKGKRAATGGKLEGLFLEVTSEGLWRLLCQTRGKLQPGEKIVLEPFERPSQQDTSAETRTNLTEKTDQNVHTHSHDNAQVSGSADERLFLTLLEIDEEGIWLAQPHSTEPAFDLLERFGTVPLPPYIRRKFPTQLDWQRYQTEFAQTPGSVAAPTAGLHFTARLRERLRERGVLEAFVTLHVGIGTFRPVTVERLSQHKMHSEWCELSPETATFLKNVKAQGGRIVAVGTTSVRTLETAAANGEIRPWRGMTNLFIRPGYRFHAVDALVTNFHLPRSTLLALVAAFAGLEKIKQAYAEAVKEKYRFYSYGDAMLIQ